jgi:hypothetical protein
MLEQTNVAAWKIIGSMQSPAIPGQDFVDLLAIHATEFRAVSVSDFRGKYPGLVSRRPLLRGLQKTCVPGLDCQPRLDSILF